MTLREETEWPETVEAGWNVLVGSDQKAILAAFNRQKPLAPVSKPFGEGDAGKRIAQSW